MSDSSKLDKALEAAGDNANELRLVLARFRKNPEDSLKLRAARFLIENMGNHYTAKYGIKNSEGWLDISLTEFENDTDLKNKMDALKAEFYIKKFSNDLKTLNSEFLINNIESAFDDWQNNFYVKKMPFDYFCELILPYRIANEPMENWRDEVKNNKDVFLNSVHKDKHIVQFANDIYNNILKVASYKPVLSAGPGDRSYSQLLDEGGGDCIDIAYLTSFAMRGLGFPVTFDFTPGWSNKNGSHYWNALWQQGNVFSLFYEHKLSDSLYLLYNRPSKVYRNTFEINKPLAPKELKDIRELPQFFFSKDYVDVTRQYEDTGNLNIEIPDGISSHAFLSVFYKRNWRPVAYTPIIKYKAEFKNIAKNSIYRVFQVCGDSLKPASDAFLFSNYEKIEVLTPDFNNELVLDLYQEQSLDTTWYDISQFDIKPNKDYSLYYWDRSWKLFATYLSTKNCVNFKRVPGNTMYLITRDGLKDFERPFTVEKDSIYWR